VTRRTIIRTAGHLVCGAGAVALFVVFRSGGQTAPEPPRADIPLRRDGPVIESRVPRNATLESLLRQQNLPIELTASLVDSVRGVFNPKDLRANQMFRITRTFDGLFREFRYQIDADRLLRVLAHPGPDGATPSLSAEVLSLPRELAVEGVTADITPDHPSLVGALDAVGENVQLALGLAEIFGGEVDFNTDLQAGDRIQVLFERATRVGEFIGYGDVRAAILETGGRKITAVRFSGADGKAAYYDDQGRSLKRQFLKSPLPLAPRVTSRFSYHRRNPVSGEMRAHLGVDYAAPVGTPVRAVASGVVEFVGESGEAGKMVRLRHSGGYGTAYLHLSAFAPGIRVGARVEQTDTIGRVGQTGTATGPHLDYRIMRNGVYVNPLLELQRMPKGEPIDPAELADYRKVRDTLLADLDAKVAAAARAAGSR
jgi:murein DD-endopeptidase MepM/ murein hydrolase activator NlpD